MNNHLVAYMIGGVIMGQLWIIGQHLTAIVEALNAVGN